MNKHPNQKSNTRHWRVLSALLVACDFISLHTAYFLALWSRFDFIYSRIPSRYLSPYMHFITPYAICTILAFLFVRLYRSVWRFAGFTEVVRIVQASFLTSLAHAILITLLLQRMPLSYYLWGGLLQAFLLILARFSPQFVLYLRARRRLNDETVDRVMLIGAGSAGRMILQDIANSEHSHDKVVCIIDDDHHKWGMYISDILVVGGREDILANVEKYHVNKIYLAIPSASAAEKRDILSICNETGCELRQLPGMVQLMQGQVTVNAMRPVAIEDLLGREPVRADLRGVYDDIHGKVVLVTGGGGSIGSELCRQVAAHEPKRLIILDIYENNAYDIQLELREKYPELDLVVLIGSVRDSRRVFQIFDDYRPQVVYHAAAHKHVPLMEDSPCEAIKNNPLGTYKTAYAAMAYGCERFVLISTDKAVNPTNIMGASKRLCEMIIQSFDAKLREGRAEEIPQLFTHDGAEAPPLFSGSLAAAGRHTEFVAVRFGNVLGSNGSVVPIFKKQIEKGGPVTVTHPDVIRYFMTVPEAVSLVMLAGTYAHGGEVFVLDMGDPVRIDTLARNLIKLSGFTPDVDIRVEYTGLRPGEKLYEEKLMAEEGLRKTENELIHIGNPIPFDADIFLSQLTALMEAAYDNRDDVRELTADMVSTYHPELGGALTEGKTQAEEASQREPATAGV